MEMGMNGFKVVVIALTCLVLLYFCWFVALPRVFDTFMQNQTLFLGVLCNLAVFLGCVSWYVGLRAVFRYYKGRP